jgi:hypothetical protein
MRRFNRVGGRVAPPASHTTVHAGPRTAVPGSPCGRSSHSVSATVIAARMLSRSASSLRDKTTDGRVLPAKFSPSRVGESSGVYPGSLPSVLRPLLTPAPARQPFLATAPTVADGLGLQVSLSKNVNFCCTTGPFISGAEHRAALCCASSPAPSTLYGLSVRRLISFDRWLPSHETSRSRSCFGLVLGPNWLPL